MHSIDNTDLFAKCGMEKMARIVESAKINLEYQGVNFLGKKYHRGIFRVLFLNIMTIAAMIAATPAPKAR